RLWNISVNPLIHGPPPFILVCIRHHLGELLRIGSQSSQLRVLTVIKQDSQGFPNGPVHYSGDIVPRLGNPLPLGTRALMSEAAHDHGSLRREQGYTAAMIVEESRMLQVPILMTFQLNQAGYPLDSPAYHP